MRRQKRADALVEVVERHVLLDALHVGAVLAHRVEVAQVDERALDVAGFAEPCRQARRGAVSVWEHAAFIGLLYRVSAWQARAAQLLERFGLSDRRDALPP